MREDASTSIGCEARPLSKHATAVPLGVVITSTSQAPHAARLRRTSSRLRRRERIEETPERG